MTMTTRIHTDRPTRASAMVMAVPLPAAIGRG